MVKLKIDIMTEQQNKPKGNLIISLLSLGVAVYIIGVFIGWW